ncbi:MAG: PAS domain S-box protein, partial [Chitinivibrionales bacterium]
DLNSNRKNLSITLDSIGEAVIATDKEGCIIRMNPVAEDLTGWPLREAYKKPLENVFYIINAKTRNPANNPVEEVLQNGKTVGLANHTVLVSRDKKEYQISDSAAPIKNQDGGISGVVLVFKDITEEYAYQEKLKTFKTALDSSSDAIGISTSNGRHFYQNKKFEELFGDPGDDPVNVIFYDKKTGEKVFETIKTGKQWSGEISMNGKHGKPLEIHLRAYPVFKDGKITNLVGVHTDITEYKNTIKDLYESERKLKTLMDNIHGFAYRCRNTPDWKMEFISNACYEITGYTSKELTNNSTASFSDVIHPEDRDRVWEEIQNTLKEKRHYEIEYRIITKEGKERWLWERGVSVSYKGNTAEILEGFVTDITERKETEAERNRLEAELHQAEKMDAIGQLAGGIAHDFNNMLSGIMGGAELLNEIIPDNRRYSKYLSMISDSAKRAADLADKLLTFARKQTTGSSSIDMHKTILETVTILQNTVDKRIQIKTDLDAGHSVITGDNTQFQSTLLNLGINASHAMPEGGVLSFRSQNTVLSQSYCDISRFDIEPGRYIEIDVCDNGQGIPQETIPRIFEPFFTTKEQGRGTGLGLAAAYGTIQQHKGAIDVSSKPDKGTCFQILLPLSESKEADSPIKKSIPSTLPQANKTILLVDDEPVIRSSAKAMLSSLGHKVIISINGKEAVEVFENKKEEIDLVILDMIMPVMNGREAFFRLKEIDQDTPVILSSGFTRNQDLSDLKNHGLDGTLSKPFNKQELNEAVSSALTRNNSNQ